MVIGLQSPDLKHNPDSKNMIDMRKVDWNSKFEKIFKDFEKVEGKLVKVN